MTTLGKGAGWGSRVVVGLDVGTTGVKAVAFDVGGSRRLVVERKCALDEPAPGWVTQDPGSVIAAAGSALAECVAALGARRVAAISLCAAMHGLVALDADRRPLTPLVTWADRRASEEARALRRSGQAAELHRTTGVPVHPMSPLAKLAWFAGHEPGVWAAARWWVGLKECLVDWLTGTLATELSSASGTGLLSMATRTWSPLALEAAGVPADKLPEILPPTAVLGLAPGAGRAIGLPAGTPVVVGAADGPLGNLGAGAITPGVAGLTLGTSGALRLAVAEPRLDDDLTLFCYALTESLWVVGGALSNGGNVIGWAGRALAPDIAASAGADADAANLELAADVPAGAEGLVAVPYLLAERAPLWDADLAGAYLGLRAHHTRAHLVRALVEGVCFGMRTILDRLDPVETVTQVRATGGAFRSALWREVMAAVLDRPFTVTAGLDGTALGAAALGLVALGDAAGYPEALARLTGPGEATAVGRDPDLVAAYAAVGNELSARIDELGAVAALARRQPSASRPGPVT